MPVDKKRAMTDEAYRQSLTPEDLAELDSLVADDELDQIAGGEAPQPTSTAGSKCLAEKRSRLLCHLK